jgi:hypothetical protein
VKRELRDRRDTAIVTSWLAGEPTGKIASSNGVCGRTVRRVIGRWEDREFRVCPDMTLRIGIALRSLILRLEPPLAKIKAIDPSDPLEHTMQLSVPAARYLHLLSDLSGENPWSDRRPDIDWAPEINAAIREQLGLHGVSEEAIDDATDAVIAWFDEKWDYAFGWSRPPWTED